MNEPANESALIEWIRSRVLADPRVPLGPGDDAAVVRFPETGDCVVTTDMLLDGSCFNLAEAGPYRVGRKAMAVNLSDIAAMAARPVAAVVSLGLPRNSGIALGKELFRGMQDMAGEFQTAIAGGDVNTWDGPLVISITLLGEATPGGVVNRGGAKPDDWIFVTGTLGGSIAGHHLDFTPRVREALALNAAVKLHALTDISDGFSLDLSHILAESGCGAVIEADRLPISDAAKAMKDGRTALQHALEDGEDFELIFSVSSRDGQRFADKSIDLGFPVYHVGHCVMSGLWLADETGQNRLTPRGYEHRFST